MTQPGIRDTLQRNALFLSLTDEAVDRLAERARHHSLDSGRILFHQGDPAGYFFLLKTGLIKLARISPDGQEKVISLVHPGEVFAEAIMFMDAKRYPVTAQALEPTELLAIPNEAYRAMLIASPQACMALLANLSMRLKSQLEDIDQLSLQQSRPRVVRYLLAQPAAETVAGEVVELPAPKHVIASRLSVTPETFSRILHELASSGLILVHHRQVILCNPVALRALC
ncbi:Crp/Fnr family transcriptional regulator [Aquisalimonas sp.]|uniref:Crp/Fnr family transcriptional regulator n=1 Tax=Aquisalimonas sp. TaxID=1872621 RepID=UPI0025BF4D8E|nr:Crp/Fnr family transcriptional regulator [Aquisalimonas sp.]